MKIKSKPIKKLILKKNKSGKSIVKNYQFSFFKFLCLNPYVIFKVAVLVTASQVLSPANLAVTV